MKTRGFKLFALYMLIYVRNSFSQSESQKTEQWEKKPQNVIQRLTVPPTDRKE